ncbi:hypothetical protein PHSY_002903 [Pseudozyma hubeiensis SY62]|uniref:Uncharacterized protein n=1 Tax=Pseudozyma hubeiensis (strain SY62) TaxID=1305764 RepID=R9P1Z2_PSEHS|nr:hypothetical protein PHSY_002903 [Pseudozyma hubeiensis SY62]GAC95328.1 hypothetical protein PHSY_002903 [Pseudozyma hubeiensis SY62]
MYASPSRIELQLVSGRSNNDTVTAKTTRKPAWRTCADHQSKVPHRVNHALRVRYDRLAANRRQNFAFRQVSFFRRRTNSVVSFDCRFRRRSTGTYSRIGSRIHVAFDEKTGIQGGKQRGMQHATVPEHDA